MSLLSIAESYGGLEDIARGSEEIRDEKENNFRTSTPKSSLEDQKKSKPEQTQLFGHSKVDNIDENKMTGQSSKRINCRFYSSSFKNSLSPSPAVLILKTEKTETVINAGKNLNCRFFHYSRKSLEEVAQPKESESCLKSLENVLPITDYSSIASSSKMEDDFNTKPQTNNGNMKRPENESPVPVDNRNNTAPKTKSEEDVKSKPKKSYKCPYCFVKTEDSKWMIQHLPEHTDLTQIKKEDRRVKSTGPEAVELDSANLDENKSTDHCSGSSKKRHQAVVEAPEKSSPLRKKMKKLKRAESINETVTPRSRLDHSKGRVLECIFCLRVFKGKSNLAEHIRTHTREQPHECKICSKTFARLGTLLRHIKSVHEPKSFKCGDCSKMFSKRNLLKRHLMTHTGEKPYECKFCSKKFSQNGTLLRHMKERCHTKKN